MKSTKTYWNPLAAQHAGQWEVIEGSNGNLAQLTLAADPNSGDYTRLTRFKSGYSTESFGPKSHDYPEEILWSQGVYTTRHLTCGSNPVITPADLRERYTVPLPPMERS